MFRVGDRVRCLSNAAGQYTRGNEYVVGRVLGSSIYTELDDSGNDQNGWHRDNFELVEPPVDNREEITIYTLIYTHPDVEGKLTASFLNEDNANRQVSLMRRDSNQYTLLAMKKFKTRI